MPVNDLMRKLETAFHGMGIHMQDVSMEADYRGGYVTATVRLLLPLSAALDAPEYNMEVALDRERERMLAEHMGEHRNERIVFASSPQSIDAIEQAKAEKLKALVKQKWPEEK